MESRNVVFFISSLLLVVSIAHADNIDATCRRTPNSQLCSSILRKNPQNANKSTRDLALVLAGSLKATVQSSLTRINGLRGGSVGGASRLYKSVNDVIIPSLMESLSKGAIKFAVDNANGVAEAAVEAEDTNRGSNAELTRINRSVGDLARVTGAVVRMLM